MKEIGVGPINRTLSVDSMNLRLALYYVDQNSLQLNLAVTVSSGIAYRTRQYLRKLLVFSKKSLSHKIFLKETENK